MSHAVRIKICCMASVEEARMALAAGADAIGLVSAMPSGPGPIPDALIADIVAALPRSVRTFLLTSLTDPIEIAEQARRLGSSTVQIVDRLEAGAHAQLRAALPGVELVQVIHVTGGDAVDEAVAVAGQVDAILLDSGNQSLAVKELGGTGRTHDWSVSRRIREAIPVPLWLAGGLRADNAAAAIGQVRPWGVDICSGVRTGGRLDAAKLAAFVAAVRTAP